MGIKQTCRMIPFHPMSVRLRDPGYLTSLQALVALAKALMKLESTATEQNKRPPRETT